MQKHFFSRAIFNLLAVSLLLTPPFALAAEESGDVVEVTADEVDVSADAANTAEAEASTSVTENGMLIEIGNTTAEQTTIIVRVNSGDATEDKTLQIIADTKILTNANRSADLSDWIAGDQLRYTAELGDNSGELIATEVKNKSFNLKHFGRNGWIKEIRLGENEMDVEWARQIFTLDMSDARMVAGLKNPAELSDFEVGDRVRARVTDDGDQNPSTWDAEIVVVLRRGSALFMRVTRWVVPAEILSIPEDTTIPYVISAKVLPSKFYEEGDVNNLVGAPDTEIKIQVNENTKLVRRYLGKATIGEFLEGDKIRVIGRLNDETGNIDAKLIKNNSIQRLGVSNRVSEVVSVDTSANSMVVKPIGIKNPITGKRHRLANGMEWTLELDDDTKIKEKGDDITLSDIDIETGDIIRIRGIANRLRKTVDASAIAVVTEIFEKHLDTDPVQ